VPSGQFGQREGAVTARRDEEVLPPGRGDESLEPVVLRADFVLVLQVKRGLAGAQDPEELGRRHEDRELQLRQRNAGPPPSAYWLGLPPAMAGARNMYCTRSVNCPSVPGFDDRVFMSKN
jgi:hypothetical protein